ncbi:MAG: GntR family transcriptional regulator [Clostridiales bacterium]|nr:GntR family transcriptional regulator [Clostridiales bacterium]
MRAYSILKEKIVNCEYAPGSMLNEAQLASSLGFSRTPIREAISILEMEGFLIIVPKKGILVTDILLSDVVQIFQTRMEIEAVVLKLAAPNIPKEEIHSWINTFSSEESSVKVGYQMDTDMHLSIVNHCNNSYIIDMMKKVFDKNMRVIITSTENKEHMQEARKEHIEILQCLLDGEVDLASAKMRTHVAGCRNAALEFFYST